jgi:hypothetical protein
MKKINFYKNFVKKKKKKKKKKTETGKKIWDWPEMAIIIIIIFF